MPVRAVKDKKLKEERDQVRRVLSEFLFQLIFTIIRYGTQIIFFAEALGFDAKLKIALPEAKQKQRINETKTVYYCTPQYWKPDDISSKIQIFRAMTYSFGVFIAGSSIIALVHIILWTIFLRRTYKDSDYPQKEGSNFATLIRFKFGFIENLAHDMPLSTLAISVFVARSGRSGLTCLLCAINPECIEDKHMTAMLYPGSIAGAFSLCVIGLTTIWRGVSVFFRWSYTSQCPLATVRGCASIFVGVVYSVLILTPALFVINYQLFALPGVAGRVASLAGFVDKLIILGVIAWIILILAACCCPLIKALG
eukprot:Seg1634.4 transcript_id=Seg1634.4/GoldUCD/mRNA.D3Y31 product="hypothetical protein" protein_id=Seg1634.4/GoldUCD/D3Y31